jgi:hypothetical protein
MPSPEKKRHIFRPVDESDAGLAPRPISELLVISENIGDHATALKLPEPTVPSEEPDEEERQLREEVGLLKRQLLTLAMERQVRDAEHPTDLADTVTFVHKYKKPPESILAAEPRIVVRPQDVVLQAYMKREAMIETLKIPSVDAKTLTRQSQFDGRRSQRSFDISRPKASRKSRMEKRESRKSTMSKPSTPGSPGSTVAMSSLGATAPEPSTLGASSLGAAVLGLGLSGQQSSSTPTLPSVVKFALPDLFSEKKAKLATWGDYTGWYKKQRSWNVRIKGPTVNRYSKGVAGGTVAISDGRLRSFPEAEELYPACCFGCLRIDKVVSNVQLTGSEMRPGLVKPDMVLGFGVTTTAPDVCGTTTLRAYDLEESWVIGYGPHVIHGDDNPKVWDKVSWDPVSLRQGDKVGLMLLDAEPRDLIVFVNRVQVLRIETDIEEEAPVFLVLDLFGTVTHVTLLDTPPPRVPIKPGDGDPWYNEPDDMTYLLQPIPPSFAEDPEVAVKFNASLTGGFLLAPGEAPAIAAEAELGKDEKEDGGEGGGGGGDEGYGYDSMVNSSGATDGVS